jgi:DNA repair protein RecO (recombination protein O)
VTSTFAFAVFHLREGRSAYNLREAELIAYFDRLREDLESVCYASYFAEFAGYYSKENLTDSALLNLLYKTFQALEKKQISNQLIRAVYELKLMVINGEYSALPPISTGDAATYAWDYVVQASIDKLYTFDLQKRALSEFIEAVSFLQRQIVDRQFHSLDILEQMQ